jgi:hypothetical protein
VLHRVMSAVFGVELEQGEAASLLLLLLLYTLQGVPMGISSSVSFILQVRRSKPPSCTMYIGGDGAGAGAASGGWRAASGVGATGQAPSRLLSCLQSWRVWVPGRRSIRWVFFLRSRVFHALHSVLPAAYSSHRRILLSCLRQTLGRRCSLEPAATRMHHPSTRTAATLCAARAHGAALFCRPTSGRTSDKRVDGWGRRTCRRRG